ncbi:hypothetical protein ACOMHN_032620 [Nucella lapillus]
MGFRGGEYDVGLATAERAGQCRNTCAASTHGVRHVPPEDYRLQTDRSLSALQPADQALTSSQTWLTSGVSSCRRLQQQACGTCRGQT